MSFIFLMLQVPESERPVYDFEFTSGMFELNSDRQLVVKTDNLDRDSPNQPVLTLQVGNLYKTRNGAKNYLLAKSERVITLK